MAFIRQTFKCYRFMCENGLKPNIKCAAIKYQQQFHTHLIHAFSHSFKGSCLFIELLVKFLRFQCKVKFLKDFSEFPQYVNKTYVYLLFVYFFPRWTLQKKMINKVKFLLCGNMK